MLRRGYLRSKSKKLDPREGVYRKAVLKLRREEGKTNCEYWQSHHPCPPHKSRILWFLLIDYKLHAAIHASPNWARREGWLVNVNGSLSVNRPEVVAALEREKVLLKELDL